MERAENLLRGCLRLQVSGAFPENLLNSLAAAGIRFWKSESVDDYTIRFTAFTRDEERILAAAARCQCEIETLRSRGMPGWRRRARHRRVLLITASLLLLAIMASSFFIWDIELRGNEKVSEGEILRALASCGVDIGTYWPALSGDMVRNAVLLKLPELRWLGLTVSSSRAIITVRERVDKPKFVNDSTPMSVTARCRGIIQSVSALQGVALVKAGDAVVQGDTLVSGIFESELSEPRYVHAQARVMARTWYELSAKAPILEEQKDYSGESRRRWALEIGRERFNFYISSSKMYHGCDKIIDEYPLAIRGLFTLPITVIRESFFAYETRQRQTDAEALSRALRQSLTEELTEAVARRGSIVSQSFTDILSGETLTVTLRAECLEDIGVETPISP